MSSRQQTTQPKSWSSPGCGPSGRTRRGGRRGGQQADSPAERTWYVRPGGRHLQLPCPACRRGARRSRSPTSGGSQLTLGAVYHPSTDELWLGGRESSDDVQRESPLHHWRSVHSPRSRSPPTCIRPRCMTTDPGRAAASRHRWRGHGPHARLRVGRTGRRRLGASGASIQTDSMDWDWLPGASRWQYGACGVAEVVEAHGHRWHRGRFTLNRSRGADPARARGGSIFRFGVGVQALS